MAADEISIELVQRLPRVFRVFPGLSGPRFN
jgi:hypothetical protein